LQRRREKSFYNVGRQLEKEGQILSFVFTGVPLLLFPMRPHSDPPTPPFCSVSLGPFSDSPLYVFRRSFDRRNKINVSSFCNDSSRHPRFSLAAVLASQRRPTAPASPSRVVPAASGYQQSKSVGQQSRQRFQEVQSQRNSTQISSQHDASITNQVRMLKNFLRP
jgi:hypothetical protein